MQSISIIIPAWKEKGAASLAASLSRVQDVEVILALCEADNVTRAPDGVRAVVAPRGRASQMNAGAKIASGDILLFLHADSLIEADSLVNVRKTLGRPGVAGGAFRLKIDSSSLWLRFISFCANVRTRLLGLPYGDQALFLKKEVFDSLGGYEQTPMLEDVLLVEQIKLRGKLVILDDYAITSARRWIAKGKYMTTARHWAIMIAYYLGMGPDRLARMFRR